MSTDRVLLSIALLVTVAVVLWLVAARIPEPPREPWHLGTVERHTVRVTWRCTVQGWLTRRPLWLSREDRERVA